MRHALCAGMLAASLVFLLSACHSDSRTGTIDRRSVVDRHKVVTTQTNPKSPAQVGNGEFAMGVDITGLQTFVPFNTLSNWSWHTFPLPEGVHISDYQGRVFDTHGKPIRYEVFDDKHPEISQWLAENPHRFTLGRLGFEILKADGQPAQESDLKDARQEIDLWSGIITSTFSLDGQSVTVRTACHPDQDAIGVTVESPLVAQGRMSVFLDFPYPTTRQFADYLGDYTKPELHSAVIVDQTGESAVIERTLDTTQYFTAVKWTSAGKFEPAILDSMPHRFYFKPDGTDKIALTCTFSEARPEGELAVAADVFVKSSEAWVNYWNSGAAIDLSGSKDPRWKELERRIVLSQYVMRVNEAGSLPPQESGLVNNGWYGRFHFEMIWWHGVHYALWNRWPLFDKSLHIYRDYLPTSIARAQRLGRGGAKWPKCTADFDREWPCWAHGFLIWQQPHPIYFAEQDYLMHPSQETLDKWKDVVFASADYMADYAYYDDKKGEYVLGPPVVIVSENTDALATTNPIFELGYFRYGLRTAQKWRERLGMPQNEKWADVYDKLAPLPMQDSVYVTYEGIPEMWTKYTYEHPALTGVLGMLPGDGVDTTTFVRTLDKVMNEWQFNKIWGWDFPMMAMAAARTGQPELAVDLLLHDSEGFQFDEHGLATGGPFPYFPSNGGLLTAVAMMAQGWTGSEGEAPGFPKDGSWSVRYENFVPMQ